MAHPTCPARPVPRRRRPGFTLIELLVTMGVIFVLIAILLPALGVARESARAVACAGKLRGFGQAMAVYANDNDGLIVPPGMLPLYHAPAWAEPVLGTDLVWTDKAAGILSDVLVCPSDPFGGDPDPNRYTRNSYLVHSWFPGYRIKFGSAPPDWSAADVVVMGEKRPDAVGWASTACYSLSVPEYGPSEWWFEIDLVRHGPSRRSNHLFFDLHVDNRDLLNGRPYHTVREPWPCFPGGTANDPL